MHWRGRGDGDGLGGYLIVSIVLGLAVMGALGGN
jgi:hypothetical protein